jgi:predicted transcriptional regulator
MAEPNSPLHGELQLQLMAALWRLQEGTVEQVRRALQAAFGPPGRVA